MPGCPNYEVQSVCIVLRRNIRRYSRDLPKSPVLNLWNVFDSTMNYSTNLFPLPKYSLYFYSVFFTHVIHNYICPKYLHHLVFSFKRPGETFWMLFTNFYQLLPEPKSVSSMSRWNPPFSLGPAASIPLGLLFMVLISACLCTAMFLWCYMAILWKEKLNSDRAGRQSWTEKLGIALRGWAATLGQVWAMRASYPSIQTTGASFGRVERNFSSPPWKRQQFLSMQRSHCVPHPNTHYVEISQAD